MTNQDKAKKIEDAARKHEPFGTVDMWSNARMDFTAGANFGYELAQEELNHINLTLHEKITELEEDLREANGFGDANFKLACKITELEQQLEKCKEQRDKECKNAIYNDKDNSWRIENYNNQLSAINIDSIKRGEK